MRILALVLGSIVAWCIAGSCRAAPADVDPSVPIGPDEIRFGLRVGAHNEVVQAANAFAKLHPQIRLSFVDRGKFENFHRGETNVLPLAPWVTDGLMWRKVRAEIVAPFATPPEEIVIGYWPLAVFVHPSNPIASITAEQLGVVATHRQATWKDLGQASDGPVMLYGVDNLVAVTRALQLPDGRSSLSSRLVRRRPGVFWDEFNEIAKDPNGMGIRYYSPKNIGTGLKVVPILDDQGRAIMPTDLAAVATGRYPLRTPVKVMVHPQANKATKDFAAWLVTAEAGRAIEAAKAEPAGWPAPTCPMMAHVSRANSGHTVTVSPVASTRASIPVMPQARFDGKVEGAVAVLPTQRLSIYNLIIRQTHQAAYEQFLFEALAADGRLKPVDRTQLAKLLEERALQLAQSPKAAHAPLVAVDVFVFSWIVSEGGQASLQVQAVHGPTASLLGELKLPINAGDPLRFAPPLSESVARWWPGVLRRLVDVRAKPVWTLVDVYVGQTEFEKTAEEVRCALDDTLAADPRVFRAVPVPLGGTQQESLLWRMGLIQSVGGRLSPVGDYLVDARLPAPGRIELRVRRSDLSVAQQTELENRDPARLVAAAKAWLTAQVVEQASQPKPARRKISPAEDEWSRKQARLEHALACQLRDKALALDPRRFPDEVMENWHWVVPGTDQSEARQLLADARRHNRRAAQLDPTWEAAAHAALEPYFRHQQLLGGDNRSSSPESRIDDFERFLATFPESIHHREVMTWCILECLRIGNPHEDLRPLVPIDREVRLEYFRKALRHYREFLLRYSIPGKVSDFPIGFWEYFYALFDFMEFLKPADDEIQAIVEQWSKDFDARPDKAPHSDFVRLTILHSKKDRLGYLKLLAKLQKQWPDPKQAEWQTGGLASVLNSWQYLFPMTYDKDALRQWSQGKRGPGDLPCRGFDPARDLRRWEPPPKEPERPAGR